MTKRYKDDTGHSYYVECQEHVSIEGRGSVLIKNTQTQVRELYKRHVAVADAEPSTSASCCTKIIEATQQMRDLDGRIESEIGKLQELRDRFCKQPKDVGNLKPKQRKQTKSKGESRTHTKETPIEETSRSKEKQKKGKKLGDYSTGDTVSSKPYFCTLGLSTAPILKTSKEQKTKKKLAKPQVLKQDKERIGGGCNLSYNEANFSPCSTYQSDYHPSYTSRVNSYPLQCSLTSCPCYDYGYLNDPSNQHAMDVVYHYQPTSPVINSLSPSDYSRCTTDLKCDDFLRSFPSSPREKSPAKSKRTKLARKPLYPSLTARKAEQMQQENQSEKIKPNREKNKVKVTLSKQDSAEMEKLRLHREYLENYKLEHEKSAQKESSSKSSLPVKHPNLIPLPTAAKIKAEPMKQQIAQKTIINAVASGTQTMATSVQDVGLNCSLDCNSNAEPKKQGVGCATQASGPSVKDVGLNCTLSATQVSAPNCKDIGLNCCLSQRSIRHQSSQTAVDPQYQRDSPRESVAEMIENTRAKFGPTNRQHQSAPQLCATITIPDKGLNSVYIRQGYPQSSPNSTMPAEMCEEYSSPDTTEVGMLWNTKACDTSYGSEDANCTQFRPRYDNSIYSIKTSSVSKWKYCNSPTQNSLDAASSSHEQSLKNSLEVQPSCSIVCEKRARCVKFQDENAVCERIDSLNCARSSIDWELLYEDSEEDVTCELDALNDSCNEMNQENSYSEFQAKLKIDINEFNTGSSSTADMTCLESAGDDVEEDDYLTCTESRTDHTMPSFSGCDCMRQRYHMLMLEARAKPIGQ